MKKLATFYVLLAATLWGSSGIFVKILTTNGLTSPQLCAVRLCVVPIILFIFLMIRDSSKLVINVKDIKWFIFGGSIGIFAFNVCYGFSIQLNGMSTAAVLLYLMPSIVMLYSCIAFKEKLTLTKIVCLVLSLIGCSLVSGIVSGFRVSFLGFIFGIISAFCYASYNILVSSKLKHYHPLTNVFYNFLIAGILDVIYICCIHEMNSMIEIYTVKPYLLLVNIALAILCSLLTYYLFNTALLYIPASKASILATFEPVAAAILGILLFQEHFDVWVIIGIGCELLALILLERPTKKEN